MLLCKSLPNRVVMHFSTAVLNQAIRRYLVGDKHYSTCTQTSHVPWLAAVCAVASWSACTEEHRALVRTNLRALLDQGINPLSFFDRDYKKVQWQPGLSVPPHTTPMQLQLARAGGSR